MKSLSTHSESESFYPHETSPPTDLTPDEEIELWRRVQRNSVTGLVGLTAVRDTAGQLVDFRYRFINNIALRETVRNQLNPPATVVGRLVTEFYPSIRQSPLWQTYCDVVETGQPGRSEQHYDLDGRNVWVVQSASPFGQDGLLLSYAETSDLHLAARRVTRQSALLNGVLNSSPNGIVVFDAVRTNQHELIDFRISLVNRKFEAMTSHDSAFFVGQPLGLIYPMSPSRFNKLHQLLETGEPITFSDFFAALGRWLDVTLTRLNDGFVATIQDITVQKQVSQQLETTIRELHRSNQNLEQFAYLASHDLQEPLRKIVSFGDMLVSQFADQMSTPAVDLANRMQRSAGRMRSLVQDLLTYARLSGKAESFGPVDLNTLLTCVVDDLEMTIHDQRATVQLESLPNVWGDETLLRHLFQNLLSNALKFHKPSQPDAPVNPLVTVNGRIAEMHELPTTLVRPNAPQSDFHYACLAVTDNGIGFDNRYLDRIFTLFQRLHNRLAYTGTGTGLAICKKVVDLHDGHITACSTEGQGTTFTVFLPMQQRWSPA